MLLNSRMLKDLNNLQTIHQIAKKLLLKNGSFVSELVEVSIRHVCAVSKSHNENPIVKRT